MRSEWEPTRIGDHVKVKHGFAFKGEHFQDADNGNVVVTPGNFAIGGGFQPANRPKFYNGEIPKDYVLSPGQVIVTMTDLSKAADTLGYSAFVPDSDEHTFLHNQRIGLLVSRQKSTADPRFLAYVLRSQPYRDHIVATASGSTVKHTAPSKIEEFEFLLPSPEEQGAIVKALDAIDDKIANNRALATDLEAMARAIFKSWFVDFDPVKAKMEGRAPAGMDADTAVLFPDEFVESELGLIPKGWEAMPFEKAFDFTMGQSPPGSELNERGDGLPFFQGSADFNTVFPSFRVYCPTPRREANKNDVLFSVRAPVGDCNIAKGKCGIGRGLCAIRSKFAGTGVTYPWMKSITADLQRASGEGVVFSSLSKAQLASCPVVVAPVEVYKAADRILSPILNLMANLDEESISLASTRDALLPRLISGKLRVPDMPEALSE